MTDRDVIAAIRETHLKANIARFEQNPKCRVYWDEATVDPGGSIFGPGPYLKVPVTGEGWDGTRHRVYAPARLQRKLAKYWSGRRGPR